MAKLTQARLDALLDRRGRFADGGGLMFKTIGEGKAYFVYRFRAGGREREMSLGPYPETTLAEARAKHAKLRALVVDGIDPLAQKRAAKQVASAKVDAPTFREIADQYLAAHEATWRNPKHRDQWRSTLSDVYCAAIRSLPVDQITTQDVLKVIGPIWTSTPETASRLRGRIESVLASAQVAGHIHPDKSNPARWKGWLDHMLADPRKLGDRGHHAAMPYAELPAFMARL